jgi:hypothetical protein
VFENRVLRKIFAPERDYVTGGWGKLHKKAFPNLCSSPSVIIMMKLRRAGHVARMGKGMLMKAGRKT